MQTQNFILDTKFVKFVNILVNFRKSYCLKHPINCKKTTKFRETRKKVKDVVIKINIINNYNHILI